MLTKVELAAAQSRAMAARQALTSYVNRLPKEQPNWDLFEQLNEEFRMSTHAYSSMLNSLMNQESEPSNASD
jgi:hypothetical protein